MATVLLVIGCCTGGSARILSTSITEPVNQLVDVVHALNRRDFAEKVRVHTCRELAPVAFKGSSSKCRRGNWSKQRPLAVECANVNF